MQIISTMVLYNYKVPVIIKKKFTFCPGQSRENLPNIFQDFPGLMNKIQGLSRTGKKIQDFPELFQDVATLSTLLMRRLVNLLALTSKPNNAKADILL